MYMMSDDEPILDSLHAVLWMDGTNSQIKLIISEENLKDKEEKKVTCSELSAVKTALEQAADAATNFK